MAKFTKNEMQFISNITLNQCHAPNILLRHYGDLGLSDRECLLLISIISAIPKEKQQLSVEDLQKYWSCSRADAEAIIAGFIGKGLLTAVSNKQIETSYSLKGLYDELFELWVFLQACPKANKKSAKTDGNKLSPKTIKGIYRLFENEKGQPLTPTEIEKLNHWIIDDGWSSAMLKEALQRAVLHGTCNFAYIDKIFLRWQKNGIKTMEQLQNEKNDIKESAKEKKSRTQTSTGKIMTNETDYNDVYNL
ncbi:MAG: DnaD domain-containing protein [Bacillota bacterium]|jgi:DNA replication protein